MNKKFVGKFVLVPDGIIYFIINIVMDIKILTTI